MTTSEAQEHRIDYADLMRLYEQAQHDLAVSEQGRLKAVEAIDQIEGLFEQSQRDLFTAEVVVGRERDRYRAALERVYARRCQTNSFPDNHNWCSEHRQRYTLCIDARAALEAQG